MESSSGHMVVNLELVGEWENSDAIYLVEKEDDVKSEKAIKKIYKTINLKGKKVETLESSVGHMLVNLKLVG